MLPIKVHKRKFPAVPLIGDSPAAAGFGCGEYSFFSLTVVIYHDNSYGENSMESKEFVKFRKRMNKTQKQMGQLLGTSIKAVHSYEQGWRSIPVHVERQMFFLIANMRGNKNKQKSCWIVKKCPSELKKQCPAWEFKAGKLCWFINGTICAGHVHDNWKEKMKICRSCEVMTPLL